MRVIGLDVGEKRVGVAASDPLGATAQPLETIERNGSTVERIAALAEELSAELLVVGLPLLMDGTEGSQAALVRGFAGELERRVGIPVSFVDERLTTRQADSIVREGGLDHREKRSAADRVAAALILRAYLDGRVGE